MKQHMQLVHNEEFGKLEILMIEGKPYFPATECAKVLGYSKPLNAIAQHCKGALKQDSLTKGGSQAKNYIAEGDLYRLIARSKLPAAVRFESWVFQKPLPCCWVESKESVSGRLRRDNGVSKSPSCCRNATATTAACTPTSPSSGELIRM